MPLYESVDMAMRIYIYIYRWGGRLVARGMRYLAGGERCMWGRRVACNEEVLSKGGWREGPSSSCTTGESQDKRMETGGTCVRERMEEDKGIRSSCGRGV